MEHLQSNGQTPKVNVGQYMDIDTLYADKNKTLSNQVTSRNQTIPHPNAMMYSNSK